MQSWALKTLVGAENEERRSRSPNHRDSYGVAQTVSFVAALRRPYFIEYGPTYFPPPGLIYSSRAPHKGRDVARLSGGFVRREGSHSIPDHYSRFVSGSLSLKAIDAPELTIRKTPAGTVEVVMRDV